MYPKIKKKEHFTDFNFETIKDDYHWLSNPNNNQVKKVIKDERLYIKNYFNKRINKLNDLIKINSDHFNNDIVEETFQHGNYIYRLFYSTKIDFILSRKKRCDNDYIDVFNLNNKSFKQYKYRDLIHLSISNDNKYIVYLLDLRGDEKYTMFLQEIETGKIIEKNTSLDINMVYFNNDNNLVYSRKCNFICNKVYVHKFNDKFSNDTLIYNELDDNIFINLSKSNDDKFFFIHRSTHKESQVLAFKQDKTDIYYITPFDNNTEYFINHHDNKFFILKSINANTTIYSVNYKFTTNNNEKIIVFDKYKTFITQSKQRFIHDFFCFKKFFAYTEINKGRTFIYIVPNYQINKKYLVKISPHRSYIQKYNVFKFSKYNDLFVRFSISSLIIPYNMYIHDVKTNNTKLVFTREYKNYNQDDYKMTTENVKYISNSKFVNIPVTYAFKKNMIKNKNNKIIFDVYGSYGIMKNPSFNKFAIELMNRGFIFCITHVRGGGEDGFNWHMKGSKLNKINSINDCIQSIKYMDEKFKSNGRNVLIGASAAGLVIGNVINLQPKLVKVVIAKVPFVDALTTLSNESLPLTKMEYEEFGNPLKFKDDFDNIRKITPYHNIKKQHYPSILCYSGILDQRVRYDEPLKWTAKLRENTTSKNPILLHFYEFGHFGPTDEDKIIQNMSERQLFILENI